MNKTSRLSVISAVLFLLSIPVSAQVLLEMRVPSEPVDVTADQGLVYVGIKFTSPQNLNSVSMTFTSAAGQSFRFSSSGYPLIYHLTGSLQEGILRLPVPVPSRLAPGIWTASVILTGSRGPVPYGFTGGKAFPEGSLRELNVVNHGQVNTAPVLTRFENNRETLDVTGGPKSMTLTFDVEDDEGVDWLSLTIAGQNSAYSQSLPFDGIKRISGTPRKGTYQTTFTLPAFIPPDLYTLSFKAYETGPGDGFVPVVMQADGTPKTFTVINIGEVDATPPALLAFHLSKSVVDVTDGPQSVEVSFVIEDRQSGLLDAGLNLYSRNGNQFVGGGNLLLETASLHFESGRTTGSFQLIIPHHSPAGIADAVLMLNDKMHNYLSYGEPGGGQAATSFPAGSQTTLRIENNAPPAGQPPALSTFSFTPATLGTAGLPGLVEFRARLTDNSAVTSAIAYLRVNSNGFMGTRLEKISGTARDGIWAGRVLIDASKSTGEYFMWLEASNESGAKARFGADSRDFNVVEYPAGWPAPLLITPGGVAEDAYRTWRKAFTGLEGTEGVETRDPDGDGYPNAVEFLCGTDPLRSTLPGGPDPAATRFFWNPDALRMEYTPLSNVDNAALGSGTNLRLKAWKSSTLKSDKWTPVDPVTQAGTGTRWYPLDPPGTTGRSQFLRLTAEP